MESFVKAEIMSDGAEVTLFEMLAAAMRGRGFALLGVVAVRQADKALTTFGHPAITESAEFKDILRCLADRIEMTADQPASEIIPSG